jgi:hypothetical protein
VKMGRRQDRPHWPLFSLPDPLREAPVLLQPRAGQSGEAWALPTALSEGGLLSRPLYPWSTLSNHDNWFPFATIYSTAQSLRIEPLA